MSPDTIRRKAVEKGLIDLETANSLDDRQSLQPDFPARIFHQGQISDVSGRGVGMDVVKTNIQKLNGRIDIISTVGYGTTITISLPLTLAILPVLVVRLGDQPFAVPLSMVREIIPIKPDRNAAGIRPCHHGGARRSSAGALLGQPDRLAAGRHAGFRRADANRRHHLHPGD